MPTNADFANNCCELLASAGRCVAKRMLGGFGISTDGLTIAILAHLGDGEKLWLKGDASTRSRYEAAGCAIFRSLAKGELRPMNHFSALKRQWIRLMRCGPGRRWRLIVLCGRGLLNWWVSE